MVAAEGERRDELWDLSPRVFCRFPKEGRQEASPGRARLAFSAGVSSGKRRSLCGTEIFSMATRRAGMLCGGEPGSTSSEGFRGLQELEEGKG